MNSYQQYWEKLESVSRNKKGRIIHKFRCLICGHIYTNHNNAAAHCAACLKRKTTEEEQRTLAEFGIVTQPEPHTIEAQAIAEEEEEEEPIEISKEDAALIRLIADNNIPYTQLENTTWSEFVEILNGDYQIPDRKLLRNKILMYSEIIKETGLQQLRGQVCGLAVDGATLQSFHAYAFILVNSFGLRLADIKTVTTQNAANLSRAIADVLTKLTEHDIVISGIVSDNARALVKAIENNDPMDPTTLLSLIGTEVLRVACAAHTGQLSINDLIKSGTEFKAFYDQVLSILAWLKARKGLFYPTFPHKLPSYISTRWNTLFECANFLFEHKESLSAFIEETSDKEKHQYDEQLRLFQDKKIKAAPDPVDLPPFYKVPPSWKNYIDVLKIIYDFTNSIERDLALQQDMYVACLEVEAKLSSLRTTQARQMLQAFCNRFHNTADLTLAKLAYCLTPTGICNYRARPPIEKRRIMKEIRKKFLEITENIPKDYGPAVLYLPAIFEHFINFYEVDPGDNPYFLFQRILDDDVIIQGCNGDAPIPCFMFARIALCLTSLPASESMVERCFSQLKSISTDFNKRMKKDLFLGLGQVKMCLRFERKYFFAMSNEEEEDIIEI